MTRFILFNSLLVYSYTIRSRGVIDSQHSLTAFDQGLRQATFSTTGLTGYSSKYMVHSGSTDTHELLK